MITNIYGILIKHKEEWICKFIVTAKCMTCSGELYSFTQWLQHKKIIKKNQKKYNGLFSKFIKHHPSTRRYSPWHNRMLLCNKWMIHYGRWTWGIVCFSMSWNLYWPIRIYLSNMHIILTLIVSSCYSAVHDLCHRLLSYAVCCNLHCYSTIQTKV